MEGMQTSSFNEHPGGLEANPGSGEHQVSRDTAPGAGPACPQLRGSSTDLRASKILTPKQSHLS